MGFAKCRTQFVMFDIWAKSARFYMNLSASRVFTQKPSCLFRRFGKQIDRTIHADCQHIIFTRQAGISSLIFQIGAKSANACLNHVASFWVRFDIAWQGQQAKCRLQIKLAGIGAFWQ